MSAHGDAARPSWDEVRTKLDLARAYAEMGDLDGAHELIVEVLRDGDAELRDEARRLRAEIGRQAPASSGSRPRVAARKPAISFPTAPRDAAEVQIFLGLLRRGGRVERQAAIAALSHAPGAQVLEAVGAALKDAQWRVRLAAANALGMRGEPAVIRLLASLAGDPHPAVRAAVEAAFATLSLRLEPADFPALRELATHADGAVAACANQFLDRLGYRELQAAFELEEQLRSDRNADPAAYCVAIGQLLQADRITLYKVADDALVSVFLQGFVEPRQLKLPLDASSVAGYVATRRKPVNIANAYDARELASISPRLEFLAEVDRRWSYRTKQMLVAPILSVDGRELLGVLQLLNHASARRFPRWVEQAARNICAALRGVLARAAKGDGMPDSIEARYAALIDGKTLTRAEWELAMRQARKKAVDVELVLIDEFQVKPAAVGAALAKHYAVPYEPFRPERITPDGLLRNLKREFLEAKEWAPLEERRDGIVVMCLDPARVRDSRSAADVYPEAGLAYRVTTRREFERTLDQFFGAISIDAGGVGDISDILSGSERAVLSRPGPSPVYSDEEFDFQEPAADRTTIPAPISDDVHFTVTAPQAVASAATFVLDVWAHLAGDRETVLRQAREEHPAEALRSKSRGAVRVERGKALAVRVTVPDFGFEDDDVMRWTGGIGNCTFGVAVPANVPAGTYVGVARLAVDGVPVSRLHFELEVGAGAAARGERALRERRLSSAFASYASEDRDEVLSRIQGMQKLLPDLDIFLDIASLRSGENWQDRLETEIASRDAFFLFWSGAASRSAWVEREWRAALRLKGIDGIDPVPLEPPAKAPPPKELGDLHFNEWTLAYRGSGGA